MKKTANSSFGERSIGRSWPLRKSWKFGPLRGLLLKSSPMTTHHSIRKRDLPRRVPA